MITRRIYNCKCCCVNRVYIVCELMVVYCFCAICLTYKFCLQTLLVTGMSSRGVKDDRIMYAWFYRSCQYNTFYLCNAQSILNVGGQASRYCVTNTALMSGYPSVYADKSVNWAVPTLSRRWQCQVLIKSKDGLIVRWDIAYIPHVTSSFAASPSGMEF